MVAACVEGSLEAVLESLHRGVLLHLLYECKCAVCFREQRKRQFSFIFESFLQSASYTSEKVQTLDQLSLRGHTHASPWMEF